MQQKDNAFLGTEPVGKLLLRLAVPAVAAQLINMLYNIVDRIYIGHMPGDGALALTGVGVCMPLILIVSAFSALVAMGAAPRASIFMGKGDRETAEKIMGNGFSLLLTVAAVLTGTLLVFGRPLLLAFGASENTVDYAAAYLTVYAVGTVFVQLTMGMNAFITAQGFARTAMLTVLIGAVCNIALDPLFIFVFDMGVRGAALATILSQAVSAAWVLIFLSGKRTVLRLRPRNMKPQADILLPCLALGVAPFVMQASESVIAVCFNASLLRYGGDLAVGAMTILNSVMQLTLMPLSGIAQGAQPISSYNFGARNAERVKKTFFTLLKVNLIYSVAVWALVMLFPKLFAMAFTPDPELIEYTGWALRIYRASAGLMGAQIACQMTFVSIGDAKASVLVAVMRKFVLLIPLIYILPAFFADQVLAVYLAEPIADAFAVGFSVILFSFRFKKALKTLQ